MLLNVGSNSVHSLWRSLQQTRHPCVQELMIFIDRIDSKRASQYRPVHYLILTMGGELYSESSINIVGSLQV